MANDSFESSVRSREKGIVRTSLIGIIVNLALAGSKAGIGLLSNSIAIILDAINNLSDAMSSVITIIGAKLGAKAPNSKHPYGYGRIEYLSSMIVASLVVYAGITSLIESIKKIITPEAAEYSMVSVIILIIAIFAKIGLGSFVKTRGKKLNSGALVASGTEAMMDAVLSTAVMISAIVYMVWNISLEAYVGAVIAIFIIRAGAEMMIETLDDILGKRSDKEEVLELKKLICQEEEVRGAYDLMMYNYGPNKNFASVHIEVPDSMTVEELDRLSRRIHENVFAQSGVILTGIGVYSYNTKDDESSRIRETIQGLIMNKDWALQMHGFYIDTERKSIRFDLVVKFGIDVKAEIGKLVEEIKEHYPEYQVIIAPDIDV